MSAAGNKGFLLIRVAIDGPGGVGKTTVSRLLAERFCLSYVDTGAMYRAVGVGASEAGVDISDSLALASFLEDAEIIFEAGTGKIFFNGKDFTGKIREPEASTLASLVSEKTIVRKALVALQKNLASGGSVIMEGRDIGTVVMPDADFKFFLDASHEVRAMRRHLEFAGKNSACDAKGSAPELKDVSRDMRKRDERDREREDSPLMKAEGAITVDTSEISTEEVVELIATIIEERI